MAMTSPRSPALAALAAPATAVLLLAAVLSTARAQQGGMLSPCASSAECTPPLGCNMMAGPSSLVACTIPDGDGCFCSGEVFDFVFCADASVCADGELCGRPPGRNLPSVCAACNWIGGNVVDYGTCEAPVPTPSSSLVPASESPVFTPEPSPVVSPSTSVDVVPSTSVDVAPSTSADVSPPAPSPSAPAPVVSSPGVAPSSSPAGSTEPSVSPLAPEASPSVVASPSPVNTMTSVAPTITPTVALGSPSPPPVGGETPSPTDDMDNGDEEPSDAPEIPTPSTSVAPTASGAVSPSIATPSPSGASIGDQGDDDDDGKEASQEPEAEPICVDAAALEEFEMDELVFDGHQRASVLCDEQGSCATAGHMVSWKGEAMMMRSYCSGVGGCRRSVRLVNSPRFRKGLKVKSRTTGLEYTAFAARYETRMEERVLKTLVHVGL